MDYRIRRRKADLDSTGYMEIGLGKYCGQHWQEGFLFVREDAFVMAEWIVAKHFPDYDHLAPNNIPKNLGSKVTAEWQDVAARLQGMSAEQAHFALRLNISYHAWFDAEFEAHKADIAGMLQSLGRECNTFYEQGEWLCILGV